MTSEEWAEFVGKLHDLWPAKELNETQAAEWRARVYGLNGFDALAAMGDYYASEKSAKDGPVPSLSGFVKCYHARVAKHEAKPLKPRDDTTSMSRAEFYRQRGRFADGATLTDAEIVMRVEHETFIEHCLLYGADKPGVVRQFRRWQDAVAATGGDRQEWDGEYWSHWREQQRPASSESHAAAFGDTLAAMRLKRAQRDGARNDEAASSTPTTLADVFAKG